MKICENRCYACEACNQRCPKDAITMDFDFAGNIYPKVDLSKCISCNACKNVCPDINRPLKLIPQQGFAAAARDYDILEHSASGGVFSVLAKAVIAKGGTVFGCAMFFNDKKITLKHIAVDCYEDLYKLQGSKYVHSSTGNIYIEVKEKLDKGLTVLFSGTPCQIAGLYAFLDKKMYKNLYTVDIICHGVPPIKMFEDYISYAERKYRIKITDFYFRGKKYGWGKFAYTIKYIDKNGNERERDFPADRSSFYWLFLKGAIYRENCYSCPFASMNRVSDITIGDWWGIEKEYPQYLNNCEDNFLLNKGISCILVNTEKGSKLLDEFGVNLNLKGTSPDLIAKHNGQLNAPQMPSEFRDEVMTVYKNNGWEGVEKWYKKHIGYKFYLRRVKDVITSIKL